MRQTRQHSQYFTPAWASELIIQRYYSHLDHRDCVLDPACGDGRFLIPIAPYVQAFGVEIDPAMADEARQNSGRQIITGDFMVAELPQRPTLIIGNPPFSSKLISAFLSRCYELLEYGGEVGFILPAFYLQAAYSVTNLSRQWSMNQEMLPRSLFEDLKYPINFVRFIKDRHPVLAGFFLYSETDALASLRREYRRMFKGNKSRANVWLEALYMAVRKCGGKASLKQIYAQIEGSRPTENAWWREKIRQIAGKYLVRLAPGLFQLPESFA